MDNNPERRHNYDDTLEAANRHISEKSMMAERARCLKAVDDEPEHIKGSWKPLVAEAKANIRKRIERGVC